MRLNLCRKLLFARCFLFCSVQFQLNESVHFVYTHFQNNIRKLTKQLCMLLMPLLWIYLFFETNHFFALINFFLPSQCLQLHRFQGLEDRLALRYKAFCKISASVSSANFSFNLAMVDTPSKKSLSSYFSRLFINLVMQLPPSVNSSNCWFHWLISWSKTNSSQYFAPLCKYF